MTRKQRKAATRAIIESAEQMAEPVPGQSTPATREQAIVVARQSLLHSLLAEEEAERVADAEMAASDQLPPNSSASGSSVHGDVPGELSRRQSGLSDAQENSVDSGMDLGAISQAGGVGNPGDVAGDQEHLGPARRRDRERLQGRGRRGKSAGPHSGTMPRRQSHMPSPPPLAASGRSSGDHMHRSASSMATWRIVKPNRTSSAGLGK